MKHSKGNASIIIAIAGLVIIAVAGYFMYTSTSNKTTPESQDSMMESTGETANEDTPTESGGSMNTYMGAVLAGDQSPFIEFNNTDFQKAQQEGKIIVLDYYADWCPICRAEQPDLFTGFDQLDNSNVVGFRVNYNDTETDDVEKNLANEHGVTYQHTKVILKNGEVVLKDGEVWDTETFIERVNSVL